MERRHEPMITSWAEMKSRLRDKFVPACYRPMIIDEWQHLRHGDGTVADYIARFDELMTSTKNPWPRSPIFGPDYDRNFNDNWFYRRYRRWRRHFVTR